MQDLLVIKLVQGAPNSGAAALPTQQQLDDLKEAGECCMARLALPVVEINEAIWVQYILTDPKDQPAFV